MRIIQVLHGWPPEDLGGTGLYVGALSTALRDLGHTVTIVAPSRDSALNPGHQATLALPPPTHWEQTWRRPDAEALFRQVLRRTRPDVVHIHHLSGLSLGFPRVARESGARVLVTLHDYAIPCARAQLVDHRGGLCSGPSPQRCARCMAEQLRLNPVSATIGRWLGRWPSLRARARAASGTRAITPVTRDLSRIAARIRASRSALQQAHTLLSPSRDLARRLDWGAPVTILNLPLLAPTRVADKPGDGPLRLLFAGAIIPTKGAHRLVRVFRRLPPGVATLTLAGPTPPFDGDRDYGARLRHEVQALPQARWLGPLPHERIPELLEQHDVLVLPSTWPENSPIIVREALAAGLRVILSQEGGACELAPQACRVPVDDDHALYACILEEVRRGRGRDPARHWPTPAAHAQDLLRFYRSGG